MFSFRRGDIICLPFAKYILVKTLTLPQIMVMKKEVIFVLLNEFADREGAFIAPALNEGLEPGKAKYTVKTLSVGKEPVTSIGGIKVLPDYDINTIPDQYAALILIGGAGWFSEEAKLIVPLVEKAIEKKAAATAICNASIFPGMNGFLNHVKHTSNTLEYLKSCAGEKYTGNELYKSTSRKRREHCYR